jgi:hypothetical protein
VKVNWLPPLNEASVILAVEGGTMARGLHGVSYPIVFVQASRSRVSLLVGERVLVGALGKTDERPF